MRRFNWWTVLLTLAITIVIVWVVGGWLLRLFLRIQGGRG